MYVYSKSPTTVGEQKNAWSVGGERKKKDFVFWTQVHDSVPVEEIDSISYVAIFSGRNRITTKDALSSMVIPIH